jgi:hypothetical protein
MLLYNGLEIENYNFNEIKGNVDTNYYIRNKTGQLKLLLIEIEFITRLKKLNIQFKNFYVCGAAPGIHYYILSEMYPEIQFILYDKRSFYKKLYKQKNITLIKSYVTQDIVKTFNNGVFISDMRSLEIEENKLNINMNNTIIFRDMYEQLFLYKLSGCIACLLKFKVPDNITSFPYIKGSLLIQPFINSNELRLILTSPNIKYQYYNGNEIDKKCQLINNYWKFENEINCNIESIKKIIKEKKFHMKWDTIALLDIITRANKLEFLDKIITLLK